MFDNTVFLVADFNLLSCEFELYIYTIILTHNFINIILIQNEFAIVLYSSKHLQHPQRSL